MACAPGGAISPDITECAYLAKLFLTILLKDICGLIVKRNTSLLYILSFVN